MQVIKPNSLKFPVASLFCAAPWLFGARALAESTEGYLTDSAGKPVRSSLQGLKITELAK
jgi:hypothetical protein